MKQLLLVRHAIALEREVAAARVIPDGERPLTPRGEARMQAIARVLGPLLPEPATLLTSPLLRTRQSAAILAAHWQCRARECPALLPGADPSTLLAQLDESPGPIVLVGHEPDLSELAGLLLCGKARSFMRIKKGGAVLLALDEPLRPGSAELQWQMNPKQLLGQR